MTTVAADKLSLSEIREYWRDQAAEHRLEPDASWSDRWMIDLEIRTICSYLHPGERVLDIGCANGFSTLRFVTHADIEVLGIDYIPEMIASAKSRCADIDPVIAKRLRFAVGDITNLDVPSQSYDKAIVIRVIINLGNWENQVRGLKETARVIRAGGHLLLSEATVQGLRNLNHFRDEWGLPPLPEPSFNLYLDETRVVDALCDDLELVEIRNFASTYYVGTRVFKPLLAKLLGRDEMVAEPNMDWNRWFSMLPGAGDYGTQKLFVFRRR